MKASRRKRATARRFSLIFVLLLAMAAWTFSIGSAEEQAAQTEPAQQSEQQTTVQPSQPPASPGEAQQDQSAPQAADQTLKAEIPAAPQLPDAAAPQPAGTGTSCPPEYVPLIQKTTASLMAANFAFIPVKALDPFVPFMSMEASTRTSEEDEPTQGAPTAPLQKMTLSEIERGLKAITWGELGKKAVIEDSTGRGYIVGVGTPAGERSGVITQIFNDRLVIQQEIWDRKERKRFPQEFTIKLVKKTDNQKQ